jgi:hypothetical protein
MSHPLFTLIARDVERNARSVTLNSQLNKERIADQVNYDAAKLDLRTKIARRISTMHAISDLNLTDDELMMLGDAFVQVIETIIRQRGVVP